MISIILFKIISIQIILVISTKYLRVLLGAQYRMKAVQGINPVDQK